MRELTATPDLDEWEIVERLLKNLAPLDGRIWLPAPPGAVSAADGSVWVADPGAGQVSRMDPGTTLRPSGPCGRRAWSRHLAIVGSRIWTGIQGTATTADENTESKASSFPTLMVTTSPRLDRNTAVRSGTLNLFYRTRRGITSTPGRCRPWNAWSPRQLAFRKQLQVRPSRTSAAGPRHPAEALAANHSDQVTLIHLAATEAGSKNGSEPARPRPASTALPGRHAHRVTGDRHCPRTERTTYRGHSP